jgi:hypothetical protein
MIHLLAILAVKGSASHATAVHATAAHATAAHTAATAAKHAIIAGAAIDATTIGGLAFLKTYSKEADALTTSLKRRLSPDEMRKVRDSSYQKVCDAMRRAFTPAEEAELKVIYARLGI